MPVRSYAISSNADAGLVGIKIRLDKTRGVVVMTRFYSNRLPNVDEFNEDLEFKAIGPKRLNPPRPVETS